MDDSHLIRKMLVSSSILIGLGIVSIILLSWRLGGNSACAGTVTDNSAGVVKLLSSNAPAAYAEQVSRLVRKQKIHTLLALRPSDPNAPGMAQIYTWQKTYARRMLAIAKKTHHQYVQQSQLAQKSAKAGKDLSAISHLLAAYAISGHQTAFRHLPWVEAIAQQVAQKAALYDHQGRWLESLELYADLHHLFKISMRYDRRYKRMVRITTLLGRYTPKQFFAMQSKLFKQSKINKNNTLVPNKKPAPTFQTPPTFSNWRNRLTGISQVMLINAFQRAHDAWVLPVPYRKLLVGGLRTIELFPELPPLHYAFPMLANVKKSRQFSNDLAQIMQQVKTAKSIDTAQMIGYWQEVANANNNTVQLPKRVVIREFTDSGLATLDPYTVVFWPKEVKEFDKEISGVFGGVGIQIQMTNAAPRVVSPLVGTPAFRAGIEAGDVIVTINGQSTTGITINQVVQRITGKPGTYVTLGIRRKGHPGILVFRLKRQEIRVNSIKGIRRKHGSTQWRFMIDRRDHIGYIRITQFQLDTAQEFHKAIQHLLRHHVHGLILDLRFNPGGYLETALKMCNMFLSEGTILSTQGRVWPRHDYVAQGDPLVPPNIPVILLVNQDSASASEIFSGSMHDLKRALLVGHRTFGKGCVQTMHPVGIKGNALMKITMAYYYLPNGECIQRLDHARVWGVQPDVYVPFSPLQMRQLEATWQYNDIIPAPGYKPSPATQKVIKMVTNEKAYDTQLDTALMMMRLQLAQTN